MCGPRRLISDVPETTLRLRDEPGALPMDGTHIGEYGIGQGKMKYFEAEFGEAALATMRSLKRALDPLDILNPGKIISLGQAAVRRAFTAREP
jgi:FAD linked oxidases, C-terminal domain